MHPHRSMHPIISTPPRRIIRVHEHPGPQHTIIHGEMVHLPRRSLIPTHIILKRDPIPGGIHLVENPLLWARGAEDVEVVEPGRDGVVGDVRVREGLRLVLGLAVEEGDVAVGAGEGGGVLDGVDLEGEGEGDVAVAVVFVGVGGVAEAAGGWGGEDEVGGGRGRGAGCAG